MDMLIGWNSVCLVCLQEGEMKSIYEKDDKNMTISQKIMKCSSLVITDEMNLPEQICHSCYDDLNAAYRFRTNCESTNIIYKSTLISNYSNAEIPKPNDELYQYRLPSGLNVKRIKVKPKPVEIETEVKLENIEEDIEEIEESHFDMEEFVITEVDDKNEDDEPLSELKKKSDFAKESCEDGPEIYQFDENLDQILEEADKEQVVDIQIEKSNHKKNVNSNLVQVKPVRKGRPRTKAVVACNDELNDLAKSLTSITYVRKSSREDGKPMKICEICGNTYKYQHALESHMRRHRNEKPFSCEFCDRAFVANVELRRHMRVHTGQKPYACRHCNRRFSDFGSRIKHERTHTGERPYECSTCGKAFAYAHVLSVHVLTHTGEKKFKCELCDKGFTKKVYLIGHMKRHIDVAQEPKTIFTQPVDTAVETEDDFVYTSPKVAEVEMFYES